MMDRVRLPFPAIVLVVLLLARLSAGFAATITVTVTDDAGRLLPDAVVMITPEAGTPAPPPARGRLASATINQKDEMFAPFVVVIRTRGSVTFHDSDQIRHHVCSL